MAGRLCRQCRTPLGPDDEVCDACGTRNPVAHPWYVMLLGGLIVLALFAALVDVDALWRVVERLYGQGS